MSLLFDALKRAQGNAAKPVPDAASRSDRQSQTDAKTLLTATNRPKSGILPYAAAGLALLTGVAAWFIYQQNQYITTPAQQPAAEIAVIKPASEPVAASSIAQTNTLAALPPTASGTDASVKKAWTHPLTAKKHPKRKSAHPPARHGIQSTTRVDPLRQGYLALSQGHLDQAEQQYLEVLAQHPHEKDALLGLAVIAQRKLQTERAADLYQQVLREDMGNATAAAGLVSLSVTADPVAAESQLRELLDIKPSAPELHYALGNVLARQLRWGEAQQSFFRAYSLKPGNALYAYNLAVALDRLHQPAAALPYYEKAAQLSNDPTLDRNAIDRRIQELSGTVSR
ncbi:MAG: tetratricopeptide repeat protein [Gallionella sp.]